MTSLHIAVPRPRTDDERWEEWREEYVASDRRSSRLMRWVAIGAAVVILAWFAFA